jgi:DNA-binding transcriptional ArsR family regulator
MTVLPHPIPEPLAELIAERLQVLGEPTRIRLLDRLRDGEATVNTLVEATGATQQNVSKHLGILLRAGLVGRRKDGTRVHYRIAADDVVAVCEQACGTVRRRHDELGAMLAGVR